MADAILQVTGLSVRYGKVEALHDGKLTVGAGQIVSVIGPNGAGKSTLLNAIMGALPSTGYAKGTVLYQGEDVSALAIEKRVSRGMCLVPEKRELFASMTVEDNLVLGASAEARWRAQLPRSARSCVRVVPALEGAQEAGSGNAVGRGAADVGGWPCANG